MDKSGREEKPIAFDSLMTKADNLMYSVKQNGRNMIKHEVIDV